MIKIGLMIHEYFSFNIFIYSSDKFGCSRTHTKIYIIIFYIVQQIKGLQWYFVYNEMQ